MMHFVNFAKRNRTLILFNLVKKANYSRRSDKNISSYKIVKSNREPLDDIDNTSFGTNANWELLTPRGFRFYLPGSIGPGWLSSSTTSQVNIHLVNINDEDKQRDFNENEFENDKRSEQSPPMLQCVAQECPMLLRKSIEELFPGSLDFNNIHLTIVTISQKTNLKNMRWSKEVETEKLAKYFVLGASDICMKLKMVGYWADFINPFSGQPYMSPFKSNSLYQTDERFRCLGFRIEQKNNCKVISSDSNQKNFVGSLFTTAPASTEFLRELLNDFNKN